MKMKKIEGITREQAMRYACEKNGLIYSPDSDIGKGLEKEGYVRTRDSSFGKRYIKFLKSEEGREYREELESLGKLDLDWLNSIEDEPQTN